jgi:hypothetical protein
VEMLGAIARSLSGNVVSKRWSPFA